MNRREFCWTIAALGAAPKAQASLPNEESGLRATSSSPSFPSVDATPLSGAKEGALILHERWQMREEAICGSHGELFSQADFPSAEGWYKTTVPTTSLGTLVRHGVYPDPYIGLNNLLIPDASLEHSERYNLAKHSHLPGKANPWKQPYWFRSSFTLPRDFDGKAIWMHLDGINYRADVWLNGQQIGDHTKIAGMFQRFRFDITGLVQRKAANAIAIRVHPLDFPGDPVDEQLGGVRGDFGPNGGDGEVTRNVTQYCTIGWDWVPAVRDRNIGIWQHIWLEAAGEVTVRDPAGFVHLNQAKDAAALTVKFHLENSGALPIPAEIRVRVEPNGFSGHSIELRKIVSVAPGSAKEFTLAAADYPQLVMQSPRLWWPRGYGDQPLYNLIVETWVDGARSDRIASKLGVRTVGTVVLPSGGRAFTVNDRIIRMTGGAWVPDFLLSWSAQRYRDEVRLMAEGNHTIVRVNGCGIMPPEVFFDECDRRGLLVWQDFSRTSISPGARKDHLDSGNPMDCDAALLLDNMKDCILRMRCHPSLLVYCGCNEQTPQADFGVPMQNSVLPAMDGTRPWLPSSSSDPSWEKEKIDTYSFGPYALVRLPEYFRRFAQGKDFASKNEIGLASPPPINSLARALPTFSSAAYGASVADKELSYHDGTGKYYRDTLDIMQSDLGTPASVAEFLFMADLYNGTAYRAIYEAANKARPLNAGAHLWKVNAALPSMMWQVYDWSLRCNAGYYGMKSACKSLHVQQSVDDFGIQVVSTLIADQRQMRVSMQLHAFDGVLADSKEWHVDVPGDATAHIGFLPDSVKDGRLYFVGLTLYTQAGEEVDRCVSWFQKDCLWHDLFRVPPTRLQVSVTGRSQREKETTYAVTVTNAGKFPAIHALLSLLKGDCGDEILPSFWNDNAVTLLPGETRQFTVTCRTDLVVVVKPHLMIEGWNIVPSQHRLSDGRPIELPVEIVKIEPDWQQGVVRIEARPRRLPIRASRITTWPLLIFVNGSPVRTARLGIGGSGTGGGSSPGAAVYTAVVPIEGMVTSDKITVL